LGLGKRSVPELHSIQKRQAVDLSLCVDACESALIPNINCQPTVLVVCPPLCLTLLNLDLAPILAAVDELPLVGSLVGGLLDGLLNELSVAEDLYVPICLSVCIPLINPPGLLTPCPISLCSALCTSIEVKLTDTPPGASGRSGGSGGSGGLGSIPPGSGLTIPALP